MRRSVAIGCGPWPNCGKVKLCSILLQNDDSQPNDTKETEEHKHNHTYDINKISRKSMTITTNFKNINSRFPALQLLIGSLCFVILPRGILHIHHRIWHDKNNKQLGRVDAWISFFWNVSSINVYAVFVYINALKYINTLISTHYAI